MEQTAHFLARAALLVSLCSAVIAADDDYVAEIEAWRAERLAELKADDGFLNLAGLFWLDEGVHSFGGSASNDIVFPGAAVARIGRFAVDPGGITMHVDPDRAVIVEGREVETARFEPEGYEAPPPARMGSLSWYVIRRQHLLGVRLHDLDSPALDALPALPYYAIDPRYRVTARLERYAEPRVVSVSTVIDGLPYRPASPGVVVFELGGQSFELEAYESGDRLFFVFGDLTSGRGTYGAGRFLYADAPGEDGLTVLDFNKAYNPPCAFNDFSTCPVASPRNRVRIRIEAGEQYTDELYLGQAAH